MFILQPPYVGRFHDPRRSRSDMVKGRLFRAVTIHNTQSSPYLHVVGEGIPSPYVGV